MIPSYLNPKHAGKFVGSTLKYVIGLKLLIFNGVFNEKSLPKFVFPEIGPANLMYLHRNGLIWCKCLFCYWNSNQFLAPRINLNRNISYYFNVESFTHFSRKRAAISVQEIKQFGLLISTQNPKSTPFYVCEEWYGVVCSSEYFQLDFELQLSN